jgi:transcription elongation factor GreA-like protein
LVRHEQSWEQAIATRGIREFKSYSVGETFEEGDFVRHKKFGDGVVARVIDAHKVEVLFRDEARTLAQAMA